MSPLMLAALLGAGQLEMDTGTILPLIGGWSDTVRIPLSRIVIWTNASSTRSAKKTVPRSNTGPMVLFMILACHWLELPGLISFLLFSRSVLFYKSGTDGAARISYHLIPRRRESNPCHVESSRIAPDWDLSDVQPTELQRRGRSQAT